VSALMRVRLVVIVSLLGISDVTMPTSSILE
jgi:hypothetical protein